MYAETVTGYVGQILDECEIDEKARKLLSELYNEALSELNAEDIYIGSKILVVSGLYKGLCGTVTDIKRGSEKETDNPDDDVYCLLETPTDEAEIKYYENRFSKICGYIKKIDELGFDEIIFAPEMLKRKDD